MAAPTFQHWQAARGVVRYLSGTVHTGISYGHVVAPLVGYCDADFAGDVDTRRSTTGYVFVLNGGAISWSSRRQPTVALSTAEAEYMAAAHAIKEALWLRKLFADLRVPVDAIDLRSDNQAAIALLKNPIASNRSKRIDVLHHFARERVAFVVKFPSATAALSSSLLTASPSLLARPSFWCACLAGACSDGCMSQSAPAPLSGIRTRA